MKADSTPMPMVSRGIDRLVEKEVDVSGVVISQVDFDKISGYGGDYYYQGYYDYYGYAEKQSDMSINRKTHSNSGVTRMMKPMRKERLSRYQGADDLNVMEKNSEENLFSTENL